MKALYAEIDMGMRFKSDKLKIAKDMGFNFISEAYETLYKKGHTPSEIAKIFEVTRVCIHKQLKNMGVCMRPRGGRNNIKLTEHQVLEILKKERTDSDLISEFSINKFTLLDIRKGRTWKHLSTGRGAA